MKRASLALRIFGTTQGALGVLGVVLAAWRLRIERQIESGNGYDIDAIVAASKKIALAWQIGHGVGLVVVLAALALLLVSVPKGAARALAVASLVTTLVYAGLVVRDWLSPETMDPASTWMRLVWIAADVFANLGLVLPLACAHRGARGRGGGWLGLVGALAVVESCIVAYANFAKDPSHALYTIAVSADVALSFATALSAWILARQAMRADEPARSTEGAVVDGGPMRTLGWALIVRVAVGVVITVATVACLAGKDDSTAGVALALGAMGSIGASFVAVVGLVGYLRMPEERRSTEAITFALVALAISAVLDVGSAIVANQLFDMVDQATHATSFWGMPSLSDMERMQATLTWAGRGATVLGLAATLVLVSSLRKTARFLGEKALDENGNNVVFLVIAVGACAVWLTIAMSGTPSETIYMAGPLTLVLAVVLLVQWTKLLFGLAGALDRVNAREASPPAEALPGS